MTTIEAYLSFVGRPKKFPLILGDKGPDIKLLQEMLCLAGRSVALDGDYGPVTQKAISLFDPSHVSETGKVSKQLWDILTYRFETLLRTKKTNIADFANIVLSYKPVEVGPDNGGPWVRLFCRGGQYKWCMGFVHFILDNCLGDKNPFSYTLSCDDMAKQVLKLGRGVVLPSINDIFICYKEQDYYHTGIVYGVYPDHIETIEGNTNIDGSANGYAVFKRLRGLSNKLFVNTKI